jgi:predicted AAA+ superfamily ATPase
MVSRYHKKKNRYNWFNDYITTMLQRDVRNLADIKNPDNIFQLLVSLSQRAGGLLNNTNIWGIYSKILSPLRL